MTVTGKGLATAILLLLALLWLGVTGWLLYSIRTANQSMTIASERYNQVAMILPALPTPVADEPEKTKKAIEAAEQRLAMLLNTSHSVDSRSTVEEMQQIAAAAKVQIRTIESRPPSATRDNIGCTVRRALVVVAGSTGDLIAFLSKVEADSSRWVDNVSLSATGNALQFELTGCEPGSAATPTPAPRTSRPAP